MKRWILGTNYDLSKSDDFTAVLDRISDCQRRQAPNDACAIGFALMDVIAQLQAKLAEKEKSNLSTASELVQNYGRYVEGIGYVIRVDGHLIEDESCTAKLVEKVAAYLDERDHDFAFENEWPDAEEVS